MRLLLLLLIAGCNEQAFYVAKANFIYEPDKANEIRVYDSIDKPFRGDCEDFAFTLQKQIGGIVLWMAKGEYCAIDAPHAVLLVDGVVYDNCADDPIKLEKYKGNLGFVMRGD